MSVEKNLRVDEECGVKRTTYDSSVLLGDDHTVKINR